jgi:hypothetical protein
MSVVGMANPLGSRFGAATVGSVGAVGAVDDVVVDIEVVVPTSMGAVVVLVDEVVLVEVEVEAKVGAVVGGDVAPDEPEHAQTSSSPAIASVTCR